MLNDAQRRRLQVVMGLIEEKMRAIERQLDQPLQAGLTFDVKPDLGPDVVAALREKIRSVYKMIAELQSRFALPVESKRASREVLKGLPQLWVMLKESDAKHLRGYGPVDDALEGALNPSIEALAHFMLEMEEIIMTGSATERSVAENKKSTP